MYISDVTLAARSRTGNSRIGVCISRGEWRVVSVEFRGRTSKVEVLADNLTMQGAIDYLNSL